MSADESPPIDLARESPFRLGALEVRPPTREVVAGEHREVLEPRVMQVLTALARRRGEVVSRDELVALCWGGRVVGEDAINRAPPECGAWRKPTGLPYDCKAEAARLAARHA